MAALLEDHLAGRRGIVDLVRGAADAWVIGPRGPLGGLGTWVAAASYFIATVGLAIAHRAAAPLGEPDETLYQALYWLLFVVFISWLSNQPAARCDVARLFARRRP